MIIYLRKRDVLALSSGYIMYFRLDPSFQGREG